MPRQARGQVIERRDARGIGFWLRFRAKGFPTEPIWLGHSDDGLTLARAREDGDRIRAAIIAGTWTPADNRPARPAERDSPFEVFASQYLEQLERLGRAPSTVAQRRTIIEVHLLEHFGGVRASRIDRERLERYIDAKRDENARITRAAAAGAPLRDRRGRKIQTLKDVSISTHIETVAAVLDLAIDERVIADNPARSRRLRIADDSSQGWSLEIDEFVDLLTATERLDDAAAVPSKQDVKRRAVELRDSGLEWNRIGEALGISGPTAIYHAASYDPEPPVVWCRRPLIRMLGCTGLRIAELCALNVEDVLIGSRRIVVRGSKTGAGRRVVEIMVNALWTEIELLIQQRGDDWRPGRPVLLTPRGHRWTRHTAGREVAYGAAEANVDRLGRGIEHIGAHAADVKAVGEALSRPTPHTFRHTYISLLAAAGADLAFIQAQAGHKDPVITMRIYTHALASLKREEVAAKLEMLLG